MRVFPVSCPAAGIAWCLLSLAACGEDPAEVHELRGSAMGTRFSVQIAEPVTPEQRETLQSAVDEAIGRVEQTMSTYLLDSDLSRFNASDSTDWFPVSRRLCDAVREALRLSEITGGAFDPTVGPLVNLWGFGPEPVEIRPPADADIEATKARVGHQRLHADCGRPALRKEVAELFVDLSAYAKGLAVDSLAELLDEHGLRHYLVEVGGELRVRGHNSRGEPWVVAIETPEPGGSRVRRVLSLSDKAVATSGNYRNFFEYEGQRYSHVIDARSGRPPTHNLASVTVVADVTAYADAMATALMVLGPEEGVELAEREQVAAYFQVRTDDAVTEEMSSAFQTLLGE
jgi:FAD:protein FMN transferase